VPTLEHPARRNARAMTRSFLSQGLGDALEWERNVRSMLFRTPDQAERDGCRRRLVASPQGARPSLDARIATNSAFASNKSRLLS